MNSEFKLGSELVSAYSEKLPPSSNVIGSADFVNGTWENGILAVAANL